MNSSRFLSSIQSRAPALPVLHLQLRTLVLHRRRAMFRSVLSLAMVAVLSLFSLAGAVQAEPPMFAPPAPPALEPPPPVPPTPIPNPPAFQILTDQSVPQMLQQAGYQVQTLQAGDGQPYWKLTSPQLSQTIDVVPIRTPGK